MAAYATLEDMKLYLDQLAESPASDAVIDVALERATSIVDLALGYSYAGYTAATALTITAGGTPFLQLPPHQAGTITSVVPENGTAMSATLYAEQADGTLYLLSSYNPYQAPYSSGMFRTGWGFYRYSVTANWGYGTAPPAIVEVCLELAINIFRARDKGMFTEIVGTDGAGGLRFVGGLTTQQKAIIQAERARYGKGLVLS